MTDEEIAYLKAERDAAMKRAAVAEQHLVIVKQQHEGQLKMLELTRVSVEAATKERHNTALRDLEARLTDRHAQQLALANDRHVALTNEHEELKQKHTEVVAERDALGGTALAQQLRRQKLKNDALRAKYNAETTLLEIAEREKAERLAIEDAQNVATPVPPAPS